MQQPVDLAPHCRPGAWRANTNPGVNTLFPELANHRKGYKFAGCTFGSMVDPDYEDEYENVKYSRWWLRYPGPLSPSHARPAHMHRAPRGPRPLHAVVVVVVVVVWTNSID